MTDAEVRTELTELHVVALTIWGEARNEPIEGKVFVGSIIRNRVETPKRWPDTFDQVCLQPKQFSCWQPVGGPQNYAAVMDRARLFSGDYAERPGHLLDATLVECLFVAEGLIGGQFLDRSFGANHYITTVLWKTAPPVWAQGQHPVAVCGRHVGFNVCV